MARYLYFTLMLITQTSGQPLSCIDFQIAPLLSTLLDSPTLIQTSGQPHSYELFENPHLSFISPHAMPIVERPFIRWLDLQVQYHSCFSLTFYSRYRSRHFDVQATREHQTRIEIFFPFRRQHNFYKRNRSCNNAWIDRTAINIRRKIKL